MTTRQSQILKTLKKDDKTTAEIRVTLGVVAAYNYLARLRDAGLVDEYGNDGDGGSIWALSAAGRKAAGAKNGKRVSPKKAEKVSPKE